MGVRGRERAAGDGGCLEVREREYEKMKFMFDLERNSNGLKLKLYIICLIIIFSIMMEIPVIPVIPVCVCFLSFNCSLSLSLILSFYQHFLKMFSFAHVLLPPPFFSLSDLWLLYFLLIFPISFVCFCAKRKHNLT